MSLMTAWMNSSASVGHPAGDPAVDRARVRRLPGGVLLVGVGDRIGEVGGERVGHPGLGLRPGDRHVQRVRVLLAVEPPAPAAA